MLIAPTVCEHNRIVTGNAAKVYGPYRDATQWRLVLLDGKVRKAFLYATEAEALRMRESLRAALAEHSQRTIGDVVDEYLAEKRDLGLLEQTLRTCRERLLPFLPADEPLSHLTKERAAGLYREHTGAVAVATHHKTLRQARAFFSYCVKRKYVAENPFAELRPMGRAKAGKLQLRQDEAKKLSGLLVAEAAAGELKALALLLQVLLGLRSAEVLRLRKRDVDCDGTIIWVDGTKSRNAKRRLALNSATVRELLLHRIAPLAAETLVFSDEARDRPLPTDSLYKALRKFCRQACVPEVCPHSLRGLHSSLAVQVGVTSAAVAHALGHASDAVTLRHYVAPAALESARAQTVATALSLDPDLDPLYAALKALPQFELDKLCAALGYRR